MADLSTIKTVLTATGASQSFTAGADGVLVVKMWGGGGAGGMGFAANGAGTNRGGAAGFTHVAVRVTAGQVVRFDVGKGGQGPQYVSGASGSVVGAGGAGGWPDGGAGGYSTILLTGGGGGSSRLYVGGVLQAVAGAGGGQGQGDPRFLAGAGGGAIGQTNTNTYSNSLYSTGGTQSAGGVNPYRNDSTSNGASLQGGQGYGAGGSPSTAFPTCGGGGGGGYYGGAAGGIFATGNQVPTSGAGGSSYIKTGVTGRTLFGDRDIVGGTADADYASNAGLGGLSRSTPGTPIAADNGTDGRIVYTFTPTQAIPPKIALDASTDAVDYVYTGDKGILAVSMWGGGGAGSTRASNAAAPGGGGGYTRLLLKVVTGDVVRFEVGKAGAGSPSTFVPTPGGWPDGGMGGKINTANYGQGGGGGSSRVWLNGVLVGVAGAGGGGGLTWGGAGGGPIGCTAATAGSPTPTVPSTGGTQSAGGISPQRPSDVSCTGKFLQGGDGWADSTAATFGEVNSSGGGGGGGYYGGGGGSMVPVNGYMPSGGGGSSYINLALATGSSQTGVGQQPGGLNDPYYNALVGRGGNATGSFGAAATGSAGAIYAELSSSGATLPSGARVTVDPMGLGSTQHYKVTAPGALAFSLWGAGGGGAVRPGAFAREGGAGGYTTATSLPVVAGDIISVEVGRGGKCPTGLSINMIGGWPDGGHGGLTATAGTGLGSGGGSTRLYKNGVLMAVAAGGGGAGLWPGGGGGGTTGTQDTTTQAGSPGAPNNGTGGTQSTGGVAASRTTEVASRGTFLQGGNGWADNVPGGTADWSGGGGGGGYFGGGGGSYISSGGGTPSGGGGSSYIDATITGGSTAGTASGGGVLPQGTSDTNYVKGRGVGGVGSTGFSVVGGNGTDGAASLLFTASGAAVTQNLVQNNPTMLVGVPGRQTFTAPADGLLIAKLWGGGGGGAMCSVAVGNDPGGGGGFTYVQIPVTSGQVVDFDVADGGQGGQWAGTAAPFTTSSSGVGGWPDGGNGGGGNTSLAGGGGGSTRLYIAGVLKAVAGGGGGQAQGDSRWQPGAGGGLVGQDGTDTLNAALISTGGTQSAGGTNSARPSDTVSSGASLKGGHGYPTGGSTANAQGTVVGGGGGGGYYGGAGGGNISSSTVYATSGAGGSSYVAAGVAGYTVAGSRGASGGVTDVDCPYGIGNGGASKTVTSPALPSGYPEDGGQGAVHYVFVTSYNTLIDNTKTTLTPTNASVFYKATKAGILSVKMWGGGGGGGSFYFASGAAEPAANGGYATFDIPITAGQVIRFDPAAGGKGAQWTTGFASGSMVGSGGLGGWPDGGAGGFNNRAVSGGGGGSSRLWIDNVLIGVAAGGGGGGLGETNRRSGAAGGLTGQASINTLTSLGYGTGGTQTAGGINATFTTDRAMAGNFLSAGRGYATGLAPGVHTESSGGGGGGGYYGGGAGGGGANTAAQTVAAGGAGGASYVSPTVPNITNVANQVKGGNIFSTVGGQDDPDYVYKVGLGGAQYVSTTAAGNGGNGGDGAIVFTFQVAGTLVENTPTALPATGVTRKFIAANTGTLKIKMWGGGGSAGIYTATTTGFVNGTTGAGNGGFTYAEIEVVAGQTVQIDVGKGGGAPQYFSGTESTFVGVAGAGGWPDGGPGYHNAYVIPGAGGGATRVFVDGVLKAVAAAGGGGSGDNRLQPGGGGGRVGQNTTNTASSGITATGGTQSAGGVNNQIPTDRAATGGYLRGGSGGPAGGSRWTHSPSNGYGGGGGYYGGAGGGQNSNYVSSGAGGSGFIAKDAAGYMESANFGFAAGNGADADLPAGCAIGGKLAALPTGIPGGDGFAKYTFVPALTATGAKVTVTSSDVREYIVGATGPAVFKLWGGGGGGSNCPTGSTDAAAGGGFTTLTVNLTQGQRLRFEVGQGGEGGNWVSGPSSLLAGVAGRGGFPDGGTAGFNNQAIAGGGGGSSRVWLDGVLLAVAGGGGAQGVGISTRNGGAGGGVLGGNNQNLPRPASISTGGTQTGGGASVDYPTDPINQGSYLRGGDGYVTGLDPYVHSTVIGGGAGGGYYGGAGGVCAAIQSVPGGAGGSGYLGPSAGRTVITDPDQGYLLYYNSFDKSITNDDLFGSPTTTIGTGVSIVTPSTKFASGGMLSSGGAGLIKATLPRGLGVDDFTIEGWFKHDVLPTGALAQVYFALGDLSANGMAVYYAGDGNIVIRQFSESNPAVYDRKVVIANDLNWHHLAVSRDADGTRLYRDGVLLLTHPTIYNLSATGLLLGSYTTAGASIFNGKTDDFRIYVGKTRYASNFTPAATPISTLVTVTAPWQITDGDKSLLLYYNSFDRTFTNDDLNGAPTVAQGTGVTLVSPSSKFSTGSMLSLPGTGHLKATLSQGLALADFTIEGWFKHDVLPTGGQVQVYFTTGEAAANGLAVYCQASTISLSQFGGTYLQNIPFTNDLNWHHLALVRDATSTRLYRDGVLIASHTNVLNLSATVFNLGNYQTADASIYIGKMDDVRVFKGKARYTANFTPPTAQLTSATTTTGTGSVPAGSTDPDYVAGIGVGAVSRTTIGKAANGGNGLIIFTPAQADGGGAAVGSIPSITMTPPTAIAAQTLDLPTAGQSQFQGYTGATVSYQATATGTYLVEMWGAGGGGVSANNRGGGGGGYTTYQLTLQSGDVLTVQSASGGGSGNSAGSPAGAGGYPDGGNGVLPAFTQFQAGGGGSSRLYVNGTLAAVAGGGGGGAYGGVGSDYQGGPGGGSSGGVSDGAAGPGTQSAGGAGTGNGLAGAFLQGGNGGVTSGIANNGAGGGGGYYGGGGGPGGGAGGSGWFDVTNPRYISGTTTVGVGHTPAGTASPNYATGVGTGSTGGNVPGGPGRVNIYNNTPTPGNATGAALPAITMGNPVGGVDGNAAGAVFLPASIAIGVPVGQNGIEADIHVGILPEISTRAVEAIPLASATVVAPINNSVFLIVSPPTIVPFSIEANVDVDNLDDAPITLGAPAAIVSIPQAPISPADGGDFEPVSISITAPVAVTGTGASPSAPIGTVTIPALHPDGSATGVGQNVDTKTFDLAPIVVTMARAMVLVYGSPDGTTTLAVPLPDPIQVTAPDAVVDVQFVPTVDAVAEAFIDIIVTVPNGMGEAVADVEVEAEPFENDIVVTSLEPVAIGDAHARQAIATVTVTPPDVELTAGAEFDVSLGDLVILITAPVHATEQGANIVAAMPAPIVINGADHEISMDVSAPISDPDHPILIVMLDGMAQGDFGVNMPGPIIVTAPEFGLPVLAEQAPFEHDILVTAPVGIGAGNGTATSEPYDPTTITLTAPLGVAEGGIGVAIDVVDIPAIVMLPPQAGNQTSVNLSLPLPTVFVETVDGAASGGNTISRPMPGPITLTAPVGGVRGLVVVSDLGPIIITPPEGAPVVSIGGDATGEAFENDIVLTAPAATATGAVDTRSTVATIVVTPPPHQITFEGAAVADLATDAPIVVTAPEATAEARAEVTGEAFTDIIVSAVDGSAKGNAEAAGLIATIQVIPPDGVAYESKPADVILDFDTPIVLHAPDATATVSGTPHIALPIINVIAPAASVSGDAVFDFTGELVVGISPPSAFTFREAQIVVGFPTIYVRLPSAVVSGDTVSANVVVDMPTTYVFAPEAYANDGKLGRILFKRSQVAGRAPFVVSERELVLNEADGAFYHRDANGEMTTTPFAALMEGLVPTGGADGQVLMGDGSWGEPTPTYVEPIRFAPSGRAILSEGLGASATHAAPTNVVYRPFFVAKPFTIADLGVEVQTAAAGSVAHLGLCRWKLSGLPGKVLATGDVSTTSTGVKTVPVSQYLTVGWYAAMVAVSGGSPTLAGYTAPTAFDSTFTPLGDQSAPYTGVLNPAPAPTARDDAFAYLSAEVA